MREDDWTGSQIDDDADDFLADLEAAGLHELEDDDFDALVYAPDENETVLNFAAVADGAKTLRDAAELLYDMADEILTMSAEGWEIVDDITAGHGTAVRFGADDTDQETSE